MNTIQIRPAKNEDHDSIQTLAIQLGYSPTKETILTGLKTMQINPDYEVIVIEENNMVVGWMTLCVRHRIEDVPFLQIAAIVTEENLRGKGFGKKLMDYAETKAKEKQLSFIGLQSSKFRENAHGFYEKIGYSKTKESFFFRKDVISGPAER